MDQENPELVWPSRLLPPRFRPLVYLDLNHWISLAQAQSGHPAGAPFRNTLQAIRSAKSQGKATFALSGPLYMEVAKIKDPAQRFALGSIMEELTNFSSLVSKLVIMELEMDAALHRRGFPGPNLPTVSVVGYGFKHAFGLEGGLRIMGPSGDETEAFRQRFGCAQFDEVVREQVLNLERSVLRGPGDDEVKELRALGWKPEVQVTLAQERADQEAEQSARFDEGGGEWRRGNKLRRAVMVRELLIEFQGVLPRTLGPRGITLEQIAANPVDASTFLRSMPSTEVALAIKTAWHGNRDKEWTANDIYDIDAMATAVPYSDVVVADKGCHHILKVAGLGRRMKTELLRRLGDLPAAIEGWRGR